MKIAINTRLLIKNKLDGIGWFTYETCKRIAKNHPEHQFYFLFDRAFSDEFIFSDNIEPIVISPPTRHPVLWYYWFEKKIPGLLKKIKPDLFLSTDGFLSLNSNMDSMAVIHDINFVHYPNDLPLTSRYFYNRFFPLYAKKAKRIATVSEYSKSDLVKSYKISPDKIDVVYNGANPIYKPINLNQIEEVKKKYANGNDYFIFIGSLHPRKNISNTLLAFDKFREYNSVPFKLIVIGSKFFKTNDISKTYGAMKYREDVLFLGRLEPDEINSILGASTALLLISKFEGFGIPVIEAMNCDVPTILSDVTSLPEVGLDAALYVNPFSIESISEAMLKMANNSELRLQLIENGRTIRQKFNWDNTAKLLWNSILLALK